MQMVKLFDEARTSNLRRGSASNRAFLPIVCRLTLFCSLTNPLGVLSLLLVIGILFAQRQST
ncbi:hypothetical protein G419_16570 [Rhodococcus triatomae BKS 15-14]|nr:hypothetical protein G419_16570 [Rhodococcus triatomae BKS 15-14]